MSHDRPPGRSTAARTPSTRTRSRSRSPLIAGRRRVRTPADDIGDVRDLPPSTTVVDGRLLWEARRRHRVSRENLAWDAKIGITTIARLEQQPRGPRRCRIRTLARLAATLGEPPAALVPASLVAALGLEPAQPGPAAKPDVPDQAASPDQPAALSA
jgi:hypothetical protein